MRHGIHISFLFFPLHISYFVSQLLLRTSSKWGVKFACCMIPWCDLYLAFIKFDDDSIDSRVPWINREPLCTLLYFTHSTSTIPTLHAVRKRPTFHPSLCRSGIRQCSQLVAGRCSVVDGPIVKNIVNGEYSYCVKWWCLVTGGEWWWLSVVVQ